MSEPEYCEINPNNYNADDLAKAIQWSAWAVGEIERLLAQIQAMKTADTCTYMKR